MGITVLGDIIAILKHAKQVQSQLTTDRALNQSKKQDRVKITSSDRETLPTKEASPAIEVKEAGNSKEFRTIKTMKIASGPTDSTNVQEKQG